MRKIILLVCIVLFFLATVAQPALAARGTPDSSYFGYGLRIDANGARVEEALVMASHLKVDWVAMDFDWNATWPNPANWDESTPFGRAARYANTLGLNLVFSIQNPPDWAQTSHGPNPDLTAALLTDLKRLYPNLLAVELYPRANTRAGWGAAPDAVRYAALFETARLRLEQKQIKLYLLAGGLTNNLAAPDDVPDTLFLQFLYDAGARPAVVSLRLEQIRGEPYDPASEHSLRHFEQIREVMLANNQSEALVWVTGFDLSNDYQQETLQAQSDWLGLAYQLMRSRLYFGASFYTCMNEPVSQPNPSCLLREDGSLHPFLIQLREMIKEN